MSRLRVDGKDVVVFQGVYPPSEDTFLLIDALRSGAAGGALELCCGTGAVGLSIADKLDSITALDINPIAVKNARQNYMNNGLSGRLDAVVGDLFSPLKKQSFDLIFMNPPYLLDEEGGPEDLSWSGGEGGRRIIDRFIEGLGGFLGEEGRALFVQSTLNGIDESLDMINGEGMVGRVVSKVNFQFEGLVVIEVRHRPPQKD
ncbi:MAG: methyltransferase [Candidatus Verstraetearchaeota archaeon]|nr:methyltransferase [Candidatus Verstraetearchaeota archaeon]